MRYYSLYYSLKCLYFECLTHSFIQPYLEYFVKLAISNFWNPFETNKFRSSRLELDLFRLTRMKKNCKLLPSEFSDCPSSTKLFILACFTHVIECLRVCVRVCVRERECTACARLVNLAQEAKAKKPTAAALGRVHWQSQKSGCKTEFRKGRVRRYRVWDDQGQKDQVLKTESGSLMSGKF